MDFEDLGIIAIILGVIFLIAVVVFSILFNWGLSTGTGEQAGIIAEVEESGIFWNPPQIKLISITPTFSEDDTVWYYGADDEFAELAKTYMINQTPVVISYEVELFTKRWEYDGRVIITDIKPLKEE